MRLPVIYSDLDGTLLDHHTYDPSPALPTLAALRQRRIPVIPCTSKTREELRPISLELKLDGPLIVENGAAVWVPEDWGLDKPKDATEEGKYWCHVFGISRADIRQRLAFLDAEWSNQYRSLCDLSVNQVVSLTGLDKTAASLAKERLHCEALVWLGTSTDRELFAKQVESMDMRCIQGGRFIHVLASGGKSEAFTWLHKKIISELQVDAVSIAVGDAKNDADMLEVADFALLVRSPVHEPPELQRQNGLVISDHIGPVGWADGIRTLIEKIEKETTGGRFLSKWHDHNAA